jgi:hypothetical protein
MLGLGFWLSQQINWTEEEVNAGLSDAARKDPFYAAKLFLQRQGVATQTLRNLSLLDNLSWQGQPLTKDDTLVLLNAHKLLQGKRLKNLLDWVERGGVVIASTDNPFIGNNTDTRDLLLDHFEISVRRPLYGKNALDDLDELDDDELDGDEDYYSEEYSDEEYLDEDYLAEAADNDATDDEENAEDADLVCKPFISPTETLLPQEPEPLLIDYSLGQSFDHYGEAPGTLSSNDNGLQLAYFNRGVGRVVINSDNHIWQNQRIECHDHAYLLWRLINPKGKVWFVINQEAPSLWVILWRSTPYGAAAALLALAFWLWAKAARFGPILTRTSSGRRSLAEHIHASAMLLWRRQQHPYLVTQLRAELRQFLLLHYPQFDNWSQADQIAHLQTLTTLTPAELDKALFSTQLLTPQDFTTAVACLQMIRKSL